MGGRLKLSDHPRCAAGIQYARDVVSERITACTYVQLACQRQLDDLDAWQAGKRPDWEFRYDKAEEVCRFIEKLRHVKGQWAKRRLTIKLQPWQLFQVATVYGWYADHPYKCLQCQEPAPGPADECANCGEDAVGGGWLRRFRTNYKEVSRKNAKHLDVETPIPTPHGWTTMGSLEIGDRVFDGSGRICAVTLVTDPVKTEPCFELEFSDGEMVVASDSHRWVTHARRPGTAHLRKLPRAAWCRRNLGVRTTKEISKTLYVDREKNERNHRVAVCGPLDIQTKDLPIPPYTLGVWLGDGARGTARFTLHVMNGEIVERCRREGMRLTVSGPSSGRWKVRHCTIHGLAARLRTLGIAQDKRIPSEYMRGSIAQRIELLRGLMDTDGTADKQGRGVSFTSKDYDLALGVLELARSLGFKPTVKEFEATIGAKSYGTAFRVQFAAYAGDLCPFALAVKAARLKEEPQTPTRARYRQIVRCDPVPNRTVRCISVDSDDSTFLCGRGLIPTHNTTLGSGLQLYALTKEGEEGAEVYSAATGSDQARISFDIARLMTLKDEEFGEYYGVETRAHNLHVVDTGSKMEPLSSETKGLDGKNPSHALIDEYHAHLNNGVVSAIETGMGAREQPMLDIVTTAGFNRAGPCYALRGYAIKVLEGTLVDESFFAIIYTQDEGDEPLNDPSCWVKSNPNLGISVFPAYLETKVAQAKADPIKQTEVLTKNFNLWMSAEKRLINMVKWDKCGEPFDINDFKGEPCFVGVDLSDREDITVVSMNWELEEGGKKHWYTVAKYYLPEGVVMERANTTHAHYAGWAAEGRFILTPGNSIDSDRIMDDLVDLPTLGFNVIEIAFDPWRAVEMVTKLTTLGIPAVEVRNTVGNLSEPIQDLIAKVGDGTYHHGGCPVLTWNASNVVGHWDAKDNVYPKKERRREKIDAVMATLFARNRMIRHMAKPVSKYGRGGKMVTSAGIGGEG